MTVRRHGGGVILRPRGPRSCPSYAVSSRHHLVDPIRPIREHIAISPQSGLYAMPSLCGSAEATREWFRAFAAHSFPACRPLRPRGVRRRNVPDVRRRRGLHRLTNGSALPVSRNPFHAGVSFRGFTGSLPLRPAKLLAPLYGSDWNIQPSGTFTSRLSTDWSPSPLLDITTTATGLLCWRDSHPLEWQLALLWQIYLRRSALRIHSRQCGHRCGGGRAKSSRMALRTAGKVG